jgi:DNA-directed RNA polymerase specialized sigma24 family protein
MMNELSERGGEKKKDWTLNSRAFRRLLTWLDGGENSDGQKYLEMQRRLAAYFDRKNCPTPDELADETLNRVARRLEEEGVTEGDTPARYCYIVARFVFMEHLREMRKDSTLTNHLRQQPHTDDLVASEENDEQKIKERRLNCLEQCLDRLESASREIILRYYVGKARVKIEHRRALAEGLGVTINALSIRACRIRDKLEACVRECVGAGQNTPS